MEEGGVEGWGVVSIFCGGGRGVGGLTGEWVEREVG